MKLAAVRSSEGRHVARIEGSRATILPYRSLETLLVEPAWRTIASDTTAPAVPLEDLVVGALVSRPSKIVCVGLNYRAHMREMGRPEPEHPTLFAKFSNALIGAFDDIALPPESDQVDWEAELAIVIGRPARRLAPDEAIDAVAGYTVLNDVSMRDWQWRTTEWLQGKSFEGSTPIGPCLVTADELPASLDLEITCEVNGIVVQRATTGDLLFGPADLVSYVSRFTTLLPGDVIATGTPAGVGWARDPKQFLGPGDIVRTSIAGIGECVNRCVAEAA